MIEQKLWPGGKPTKDEAETQGMWMARLVVAEIMSQPVRVTVGKIALMISSLPEDKEYEEFRSVFWNVFASEFEVLVEASPRGMQARADVSRNLVEEAAEYRQEAVSRSIEAVQNGGMSVAPLIEELVREGEQTMETANKLYSPALENLNKLINSAKDAETLMTMRQCAEEHLEDKMHDCKCGDPDCTGHTNH